MLGRSGYCVSLSKVSDESAACPSVTRASRTLVLKPILRSASRYSRKSASSGAIGSMTSSGIFAYGFIAAHSPLMSKEPHFLDQ